MRQITNEDVKEWLAKLNKESPNRNQGVAISSTNDLFYVSGVWLNKSQYDDFMKTVIKEGKKQIEHASGNFNNHI